MSLTTKPSIYHDIENVNTKNEKNLKILKSFLGDFIGVLEIICIVKVL
jgi:hypothetical protein